MSRQQEMFGVVEAWQTSGLSKRAFARQNGIEWSSFRYWHRRYQEQVRSADGFIRLPESVDLIQTTAPVPEAAEALQSPRVRLELPGVVIVVY